MQSRFSSATPRRSRQRFERLSHMALHRWRCRTRGTCFADQGSVCLLVGNVELRQLKLKQPGFRCFISQPERSDNLGNAGTVIF